MKEQIIVEITKAVMSILAVIVTAYVIPFLRNTVKPYLESKRNESDANAYKLEVADLLDYICKAVQWANQTIPAEEWERRKTEVMGKVVEYMNKYTNLDFSVADLETIMEAFVKECKNLNKKGE